MSTPTARRRVLTCAAVTATATAAALATSVPAQAAPQQRTTVIAVKLTGGQIPGDDGDDDGRGFAVLKVNPKKKTVCYAVSWKKLSGSVTAMHLHKADRGETGPHAVDLLNDVKIPGKKAAIADCVTVEDGGDLNLSAKKKIRAMIDHPEDFYLNVHTSAHEHGAIRGQLD